jgi:hypothetical protein
MAEKQDVYWKLAYDINLPRNGKVKVHGAQWDEERQALYVYVSTSDTESDLSEYQEGVPLYEPAEDGVDELIGMNPYELGDPPQTLVKGFHRQLADHLLGQPTP